MKEKILITILAIALVSGCSSFNLSSIPGISSTSTTTAGQGLEITSFSAEPTAVYSGTGVRLELDAENMGSTTVNNNSALIYLLGSDVKLDNTSGTYWYGKSAGNDRIQIRHFTRNMTPSNVVTGVPANTERVLWNLVAPTITPGQTRDDSFIARIYNDYSSGVNGNIWVYTDNEAQATKTAGRALETSSFTPVSGPLAVSVKLSPDPVVLYGDNSFTFSILITNSATGTIYKSGSIPYSTATVSSLSLDSDTQLNWINVGVDSPGLTISDCTGDQQLFGGKPLTLVCTATLNSAAQGFQSFPIKVSVNYGYYTQSEISVTVQGKSTK